MISHSIATFLALLTVTAAQTAAAPRPAGPPPGDLPVSLARIRSALKKPEGIKIVAPPKADFTVDVTERQRFRDLLDLIDFGSGPVPPGGWYAYQQGQVTGRRSQPLATFDVGALGQSVGSAISKARRERSERLARDEVRRALIDFCATRECPAGR